MSDTFLHTSSDTDLSEPAASLFCSKMVSWMQSSNMRTWVSLYDKTQKEHCIGMVLNGTTHTRRFDSDSREREAGKVEEREGTPWSHWWLLLIFCHINDSVYLLALVRQIILPLLATLSAVSIRAVRLSCCSSVILHNASTAATSPCRMLQHSGSSRGLGGPTAARADMSCQTEGETA